MKPEFHTDPAPFELIKPKQLRAGILFASPHSGRFLPSEMLANSRLSSFALRSYQDAYVDKIIEDVPRHGLVLIAANYSRSYIDVNRDPNILDGQVVAGVTSANVCEYTANGYGLIARQICQNSPINISKITLDAAKARIANVHAPYHFEIAKWLENMKSRFGEAWLFDVHSMPNSALGGISADIVLGNRFGSSCDEELTKLVKNHFENAGLKVRLNQPYAGAHSTKTYGKPAIGQQALQIEINRSLYLNEHSLELNDGFAAIKRIFGTLATSESDFFNHRNLTVIA